MYSKMEGEKAVALKRTDSICPPPEEVLLQRVLKNNTEDLDLIVNEALLKYIYDGYSKPILLVACIEEAVEPLTIQALIDLGADIRFSDENQWEALHFAAKRTNYSVLKVVIDNLKARHFDINDVLAQSSNALHILIRYGESQSIDFIKCAKLLIQEGINVNSGDSKFISPILWAAKNGSKDVIKVILENSPVPVDLDSHKLRGQTARDIITIKNLYEGYLPEKIDNNNQNGIVNKGSTRIDAEILFNYVKLRKENEFLNYNNGDIRDFANIEDGSDTLLQMACDKGSKIIVEHLLNNGADQSRVTNKNKKTPLEITADHGFHEIFSLLLNRLDNEIPMSVLISLVKCYDYEIFPGIDRKLCCKYLLDKLKSNRDILNINGVDESMNSPLHYAVRYGDVNIINDLLQTGASLGSKNKYGIMPIQDMEPEALNKHLDNCVQFDFKGKKDKEDFSITFDYRTLIPPTTKISRPDSELGINSSDNQELVLETEVISYMSTASEFKHLLTHPVIVSFLFMKWHRIRWLFYTNLAFYIAFFVSLVTYVFSYYANFEELTSFEVFLKFVSWITLLITFFVLLFRELFQIAILPKKYFRNFENYLEMTLIIIAGWILFVGSPSIDTRKQLSSLSILLAAFELVLMLGQHPKLSTNVVMLRTVSYDFFKFLLWYSILIVAFALSFNILFSAEPKIIVANQTESESDDDSFENPGKSVFKTIVMLTGEFEASDINFEAFPFVSKLIFVLFIFMIAIILLNLLNGLAVSDTQTIRKDAELLGHISRAQHIFYVETMMLGNILPKSLVTKLNDLCCCLPFDTNLRCTISKPLAEKVCLFPHLFNYEMTVYPNRYGQIYIPMNKKQKCCHGYCYNIYLDKETILRINALVQFKKEQLQSKVDIEMYKSEIVIIKNKLDDLLNKLQSKQLQ
ncbi:transient receptor potential cation channel protein painless-like [Diorhabda carinulata]|uniref:transient receptor potential cation channel protein painless-like n=1 Tax=Diorhabda carinulata TaxID=1163345 RepID=UPI0025A049C8|nr:transient receptor potential cation channel protein painless-like [Diorhabda carinulata]XP_057670357.1 transient receptor potential cation channel protein painless-like [Diorhabda carinulata]XP_057670358.1 transient receptor potential cation channel protein painless-like [Diorhabda carinulata]